MAEAPSSGAPKKCAPPRLVRTSESSITVTLTVPGSAVPIIDLEARYTSAADPPTSGPRASSYWGGGKVAVESIKDYLPLRARKPFEPATEHELTLTGLEPATTYTVRVRAKGSSGRWGQFSAAASVTTAEDTERPAAGGCAAGAASGDSSGARREEDGERPSSQQPARLTDLRKRAAAPEDEPPAKVAKPAPPAAATAPSKSIRTKPKPLEIKQWCKEIKVGTWQSGEGTVSFELDLFSWTTAREVPGGVGICTIKLKTSSISDAVFDKRSNVLKIRGMVEVPVDALHHRYDPFSNVGSPKGYLCLGFKTYHNFLEVLKAIPRLKARTSFQNGKLSGSSASDAGGSSAPGAAAAARASAAARCDERAATSRGTATSRGGGSSAASRQLAAASSGKQPAARAQPPLHSHGGGQTTLSDLRSGPPQGRTNAQQLFDQATGGGDGDDFESDRRPRSRREGPDGDGWSFSEEPAVRARPAQRRRLYKTAELAGGSQKTAHDPLSHRRRDPLPP